MTEDQTNELAAENEQLKTQVAELTKQLKALSDSEPKEEPGEKPEEVREELSRQAADYMAKFGELGAGYFAARKPLAECYGEFVGTLQTKHAGELAALQTKHEGELTAAKTLADGLQGKVNELSARLIALGDKGGEMTPVSGGVAGGSGSPHAAGEYSSVLPANLARVAAGIKIPVAK